MIEKKNIIVGAGPGGLQLAYYFEKNNIDYLVLERELNAGAYFETYPRHRQLISINKVYTGFSDEEKNLRHDWNSLLSDENKPLLKDYTEDFFPNADYIVEYFKGFARSHNLKIRYNTEVVKITKQKNYVLKTKEGNNYTCEKLIMATGVSKPFLPKIKGVENCSNYTNCSIDPVDFRNKRVLIIGKGNSAFETADNLVSVASKIHVSSPTPLKMAWKSHFVGHLRAVNNNFLDTYQLKSQNAIIVGEIDEIIFKNDEYVVTFSYQNADGEVEKLIYDDVILCTGFRFDASVFDETCKPELTIMNRFPKQKENWESSNVQNLFFAGTITQVRDFKKSTSGFIHGFRYNSKCLFHILQEAEEGTAWPGVEMNLSPKIIAESIINNVNRTSALWQQFGFIGDVISIDSSKNKFNYIYNIPVDYAKEYYCSAYDHYFIITLEYGNEFFEKAPDPFNIKRVHRNDFKNAHLSAFLHPIIREYTNGKLTSTHHVIEDFDNKWEEFDIHIKPLLEYLKSRIEKENGM